MAKRRRNLEPTVSLFPFLSILACVIGTLTLLIAALSLSEMVQDEGLGLQFFRWTSREAEARAEYSDLNVLVEQAEALARKIAQARAVLAELETDHERKSLAEARTVQLLAQIERTRRDNDGRSSQLGQLQERIAALERQVQARNAAADALRLTYSGGRSDLRPHFIECTEAGLVLYPNDPGRRALVPAGEIAGSRKLGALFSRVKAHGKHTAIFLVRPGGVKTLDAALARARAAETRHGYLPVPGRKTIDFGAVTTA